ncbi:hypothetical protein [Stenotrophomonas maltophilia]|uniref:hypothetical protein n=1 Tax=Stenotrophomonas maltophilia TaxID=40324 RepID=UPI00066C725C|nr:hypothetical protein [Stenotrophomonas maltophilia]
MPSAGAFQRPGVLGHCGDVLGSHSRTIYNPVDGLAIAYATKGERIPTSGFLQIIFGIVYVDDFTLPALNRRVSASHEYADSSQGDNGFIRMNSHF